MNAPTCPYCQKPAELVTGAVIYPHRRDLAKQKFWECRPCSAWVGCHLPGNGQGDGTTPLGRLANAELRQAKQRAHAAFDPLWRERRMTRRQAYAWLAEAMGMPVAEVHIGAFDVGQCRQVVEAVAKFRELA